LEEKLEGLLANYYLEVGLGKGLKDWH